MMVYVSHEQNINSRFTREAPSFYEYSSSNRIRDKHIPFCALPRRKGWYRRSKCDICRYSIMPSTLVCLIHSTRFYVNMALGVLLLLTQEEIFKSIRPEETQTFPSAPAVRSTLSCQYFHPQIRIF